MKCIVRKSFNAQTVHGQMEMSPGQAINLPDDKALSLMQAGKIELADPEQQHTYQERSATMDRDGGSSNYQAYNFDWCREVCMLTPPQREQCEAVKPCPKG